jgi:hypothetical protein
MKPNTLSFIVTKDGMVLVKATPGYELYYKSTDRENYIGKFRDKHAAARAFRKVKRTRTQLTLDFPRPMGYIGESAGATD